jgi:hypothetical protein
MEPNSKTDVVEPTDATEQDIDTSAEADLESDDVTFDDVTDDSEAAKTDDTDEEDSEDEDDEDLMMTQKKPMNRGRGRG